MDDRRTNGSSLLVPHDGCQAKNLLCDRGNPGVGVTVRRSPETRETSASRIVDDLHRPCKLSQNLLVRQGRHVRVCVLEKK